MILVQRLRVVHPAIQSRREVLRDAHNHLHGDHAVGGQAEDAVGALQMRIGRFVVFDDREASDGGEEGDVVEGSVGVCALLFLLCRVRWLHDEDALDEEEHRGGVEELEWSQSCVDGGWKLRDEQDAPRTVPRRWRILLPRLLLPAVWLSVCVVGGQAAVGVRTIHAPN